MRALSFRITIKARRKYDQFGAEGVRGGGGADISPEDLFEAQAI